MMMFPISAAAPLFDALVDAQNRFDAPERLFAISETAYLNGSLTPRVFYFYGTGLRYAPGRAGEASGILARVGPGEPYHPLALYSLGQIAAERRDVAAAEELFRRVEREAGGPGGNRNLARRAARSRAELLLAAGRGAEAAPVFERLLHEEDAPLDRIGLASSGADPVSALERLPAGVVAALPLKERIRYLLLLGGLARENGRLGLAIDRLTRAEKDLEDALSGAPPLSPERSNRAETLPSLRTQIERLRSLRERLARPMPARDEAVRADVLELLAGLLVADWTVARAAAETPAAGVRFLSRAGIEEVFRRIEVVGLALDGIDVDRFMEQLAGNLKTLRNVGRPAVLYRSPDGRQKEMEGGTEIQDLWERVRQRRSAAVDGILSARDKDVSHLLGDLWVYKEELDRIRSVYPETWETTLNHYGFHGKGSDRTGDAGDPLRRTVRETVAYVDGQLGILATAEQALEKGEQAAARERRKQEVIALRGIVLRQLADALIAQARRLREDPGEEARKASFAALERVGILLAGDRLAPADAADIAVQAGLLLAGGRGRWEPFPGRAAGEQEKEMISHILRLLPAEAPQGFRPEESAFLRAVLRLAVEDPLTRPAIRDLLRKYPASPITAEMVVRLGHEVFLADDTGGAVDRYRVAAEAGAPETSAVARYMLAWIRFQSGDVEGTVRELSPPLSDPSFQCGELSPFEREIVSLSVRAWSASPPERLESYRPVNAGTCGGKALLAALWEADERRGEVGRAAKVRDVASRRYPGEAAVFEIKTVEALLRAGQDRDAFARAIALRGKYGPGSAWARSQPAPVPERTAAALAAMLKTLSERKFDEGIRSGDRSAMSSAAALMGEYFGVKEGETSDQDAEMRLKWAIARLGSGDRPGGVRLLEELADERRGDATGERAAVLYAETMIAGYERKVSAAEDAEHATLLLLGEHPSGKAVTLAFRASSALLAGREYVRARRLAEKIEGSLPATRAQVVQARLMQAEAALYGGDLAAAREKAALVEADPAEAGDPGAATRARDLYLLSSLKEVEEKTSSGDPAGAAARLEELSLRFPKAPETPLYLLRATRLYAQGGDAEGALRSGLRFLKEYPRRKETAEAVAVIGPLLEGKREFARAGELYEGAAESFPKSEAAPRFLFQAARVAESHGAPEAAERRFSVYRARYPDPAWRWTYATLSVGLSAGRRGDTKTSLRLMEEGLRKVDSGLDGGAPGELAVLAARARIAVGENWARQFRDSRLVAPLEKSLAVKERFFRRALGAFAKAESVAPLELSLQASRLTGDLFLEYGKAILASQRPRGLKGPDRAGYEDALKVRARSFFERSVDRYAGTLERLEKEGGAPDLAVPIRERLAAAQALLEGTVAAKEGKAE
jgi:TolA-binding protein